MTLRRAVFGLVLCFLAGVIWSGHTIAQPRHPQAVRTWNVHQTHTPPPPPTVVVTVPAELFPPAPGDCDDWRQVFHHYGATDLELAFFIDSGVIWRESRCALDTLNEATGDSGVCQIGPAHNRAGYFGRRPYGDGGWLHALHGLTVRQDTDSTDWAAACLTLYRSCGEGPWNVGNYSCLHRRYPDDL